MQNITFLQILAFLLAFSTAASAVESPELGAVALHQALLDLGNNFRLMCVAAHPDDEDGATLAYYRMKYGVKTYAVIATRGEGGQNEIGPELYEDLAEIRTREMQAAANIEGAELHFLDLPEFGFSKSIEETFEKWGHEEALRRMVEKIREIQPDVIITHHGRLKDHGHHQAIGQVVQEAFAAAADPSRFPEQMEKLGSWQVKRLFIRNWEGTEGSCEVPIHELEPVRGMTYAEIAAMALQAHHSQGMGFFIDRLLNEQHSAWYDLVQRAPDVQPPEPQAADRGGRLLSGLRCEMRPMAFDAESDTFEATAAGLRLAVKAQDPIVVPGQSLDLAITLECFGPSTMRALTGMLGVGCSGAGQASGWVPSLSTSVQEAPLHLVDVECMGQTFEVNSEAPTHQEWHLKVQVPETAVVSFPKAEHLRDEAAQQPLGQAQANLIDRSPPPAIELGHSPVPFIKRGLTLEAPVEVPVASPVRLAFARAPYLLPEGNSEVEVILEVTNHQPGPLKTEITLEADEALRLEPRSHQVQIDTEDGQEYFRARLRNSRHMAPGSYTLRAHNTQTGAMAETTVRVVNYSLARRAWIGLLSAYDTTLAETLEKLGLEYEKIDAPEDYANLDRFTTILVDMRAYQYRKDLIANNARLLEYVKQGGNVVVMYQKDFDWKPEYAPYPLHVSRNRVTREDAPVTVLAPEHPLFLHPNKIVPADWEGWVQERGLYFPDQWDPHYTPLLEMQDPGESIPPGALLTARYGQGNYSYCSLVLYRQLRELNPGALRLFVNLLALSSY